MFICHNHTSNVFKNRHFFLLVPTYAISFLSVRLLKCFLFFSTCSAVAYLSERSSRSFLLHKALAKQCFPIWPVPLIDLNICHFCITYLRVSQFPPKVRITWECIKYIDYHAYLIKIPVQYFRTGAQEKKKSQVLQRIQSY